eukprot:6457378-Amphidinium_carterae.1
MGPRSASRSSAAAHVSAQTMQPAWRGLILGESYLCIHDKGFSTLQNLQRCASLKGIWVLIGCAACDTTLHDPQHETCSNASSSS